MPEHEMIRNGSEVAVILGGDLVASTVADTRNQFKQILAEGVTGVAVDLSRVYIIDSQGIGLLVALHNSLEKSGGTLAVTNASAEIVELFKSMRLDRHFTIAGRVEKGESHE